MAKKLAKKTEEAVKEPMRVGVLDEDTATEHVEEMVADLGVPEDLIVNAENEISVYDALVDSLSEDITSEPVNLIVPKRPNMYMTYSTSLDLDLLQSFYKRATTGRGGKKKIDQLKLACIVLSTQCVGMAHQVTGSDEIAEVTSKNGEAMTFANPEVAKIVKSPGGVIPTIRKVYGADGHIVMTMKKILEECGYTDIDFDEEDAEEGPLDF